MLATLIDLYIQGYQASKNPADTPLFELIGAADGYNAMMRGGILGWLLAVFGAVLAGVQIARLDDGGVVRAQEGPVLDGLQPA